MKKQRARVHMHSPTERKSLNESVCSTPARQRLWREGIYEHIRELMPLQGRLSIEPVGPLVVVTRRGFYHLQVADIT